MKPRELGQFGCDFASFVFLCSTVFVSRVQLGDLGTVACNSSNGTQSCIDCDGKDWQIEGIWLFCICFKLT